MKCNSIFYKRSVVKTILFVVLCVVILSGCGDKAISPSTSDEVYEYYPLQVEICGDIKY